MFDFDNFQRSLKDLELQNENRNSLTSDLPPLLQEAVDESVIQRFEVCYDVSWKALRRYLTVEQGLSEVTASPRSVFRIAGEIGVLTSPVERWMEYVNLRIGTAHDYNREKATAALEMMDEFIADAKELYRAITGESWK